MNDLKQIDQALMTLLGQRIEVLRSLAPDTNSDTDPDIDSELSPIELHQQLGQQRIPTFVWNNLVTNCIAASKVAAKTPAAEAKRIVVIGGSGQMGRFFGEELAIAGHQVQSLGRDWQQSEHLLTDADLVLICVPIAQTLPVIRQVATCISPNTTLADITGIKTPIVEAMLKHHSGPVLSLHPMFGPGVSSFMSQNVVVCPGRRPESFHWFLELLRQRGASLADCTPEEHDEMMVTVQAIRLFFSFGLGVFLAEAGVDLDRSLELASPPYRMQLNLVSRLFAQNATLSTEMMTSLEERRVAIGRFAIVCSYLSELVKQNDQASLQQLFESTRPAFQTQMPRALLESNHLIESLSVLLASQTDVVPSGVSGDRSKQPVSASN